MADNDSEEKDTLKNTEEQTSKDLNLQEDTNSISTEDLENIPKDIKKSVDEIIELFNEDDDPSVENNINSNDDMSEYSVEKDGLKELKTTLENITDKDLVLKSKKNPFLVKEKIIEEATESSKKELIKKSRNNYTEDNNQIDLDLVNESLEAIHEDVGLDTNPKNSLEKDGLFLNDVPVEKTRLQKLVGRVKHSLAKTFDKIKETHDRYKPLQIIATGLNKGLNFIEKGIDTMRKNPKTTLAVAGVIAAGILTSGGLPALFAIAGTLLSGPVLAVAAVYTAANFIKNKISPSEVYKTNKAERQNSNENSAQQNEEIATQLESINGRLQNLTDILQNQARHTSPLSEANTNRQRTEKNKNARTKNNKQKRRHSM